MVKFHFIYVDIDELVCYHLLDILDTSSSIDIKHIDVYTIM